MLNPTRALAAVLAIALVALLAALLSPPVWAAENTLCGAYATGRASADDPTVITGIRSRWFVGADGIWHPCKPHVKDGEDPAKPEPKDPPPTHCPSVTSVHRWSVGEARCDSDPRGSYTGSTSHIRPRTPNGYPVAVDNFAPGVTGQIVYVCIAGEWIERGRECNFASPTTPAPRITPAPKPKPRAGDAKVGPIPKPRK